MHADPHGGNLLKCPEGLAYIDFGMVSEVPQQVREGLLCAVAYLVAEEYGKVASLFGDLMLIPPHLLEDPQMLDELTEALRDAANAILERPDPKDGGSRVPQLRFDRLIGAMASFAPRFQFTLPPYFLNNARAIGALEGLAKTGDFLFFFFFFYTSVLSNARAICALEGLTLLTLLNSGPNLQPALGGVQLLHPPAPHFRLAQASSNSGRSYLQPPDRQAQPKPHEGSGQRSSDDLRQTQEGGGVGRRQDPWGAQAGCPRSFGRYLLAPLPGIRPSRACAVESERAREREREKESTREPDRRQVHQKLPGCSGWD